MVNSNMRGQTSNLKCVPLSGSGVYVAALSVVMALSDET